MLNLPFFPSKNCGGLPLPSSLVLDPFTLSTDLRVHLGTQLEEVEVDSANAVGLLHFIDRLITMGPPSPWVSQPVGDPVVALC